MTAAAATQPPDLLPAAACLIRIVHGPGCSDARTVAALLDRAAHPSHPDHPTAVRAARKVLDAMADQPAVVS
jgi:hypothetical protein